MNTSLTAYTHLESLLLFQSLHAYGVGPSVFSRISELLKNNPHITGDKRFQSGRLSPDALRSFYLAILKEEVKSEQGAGDGEGQNGEVKNSRKRKAPSPNLPSVQESVQHQHLIPKLVNKLYARYRSAITSDIRHDEEKRDRLVKELQGIENGECDDQIKERVNGKSPASRSPSLPRKSPLLPQKPLSSNASPQPGVQEGGSPPPNGQHQNDPQQPVQEPAKQLGPQNGDIQAERNTKNAPGASPRKKQIPSDRRGTPSTPQPPQAPVPSLQKTPQPIAPPPKYPPQQSANAGYNGSPYAHRSPYPPQSQGQSQVQPPQHIPPQESPHPSKQAQPQRPQSTAIGPPTGPHYQQQPAQQFTTNGVPQYGAPGVPPPFSPTHQHFQGSPGIQTPQQQRGYYPYPGQTPYPPQQPQMGQPPPQGGFMLPPFQVSPQDPSRAHQQSAAPSQYPQVSTPLNTRQSPSSAKVGPAGASAGRPGVPSMHPLVTQARHSFSTPIGTRSPHSAIGTPRSAKTIWKSSVRNFASPPVPRPEVSPIDDVGSLKQSKQSPQKNKSSRRSRINSKAKDKEAEKENEKETEPTTEQPEETVPELETRQGRSRRKTAAKRARPRSIASSQTGGSIRERSRSQSILSHTETVAADTESQAGNRIKSERATSIDIVDEDAVSTPTHMSTRRRGGTLQTQSNKRKRAREASPEESEGQPGTPGLTKTVIAPRHFSRMCNPIMNDIGSHKHASTFTTAVKAKDAEGYYDIIKRPTDLKTIQKAIAVGAKQVAAAATDTPAGSPGGGGGIVELPMTVDNIPPKAIVNSAQLEKELMRMFVNAVMFNAGEEGVVEDAREMFQTVQQSVSSWRSVERSSGRLEVEETPVPEEEIPATSKRRKL